MKIRHKLMIVFISVSLFIAIVSGYSFFVRGQDLLVATTESHLQSIVILKENQLNKFVDVGIGNIEEIAEWDQVKDLLAAQATATGTNAEFEADLKNALGRRISHTDFVELFIIDNTGTIRYSTSPERTGALLGNETYYNRGKEQTYVQNFYYDVAIKQLAITISSPVKNASGETVGVAAGRINMDQISNLMTERSGMGKTGETYLVNKFNFAVSELKAEKGAVLKKTIYSDPIKNCLEGKSLFSLYDNYGQEKVFGFYKWLPKREVCLLAEISQDEALKPIIQLRNIIFITSILIIVFSSILITFFSHRFTGPLVALKNAALKISKGRLDTKISVESHDEVGELAQVFNDMTDGLKESREKLSNYNKNLEREVAERTKELEVEKNKTIATLFCLADGLLVLNTKKEIIMVNPVAEKIIGVKESDVLNKNINHIREIPEFLKLPDTLKADSQEGTQRFELTIDDAVKSIYQITVTPAAASGKVFGTIIVLHDITREKNIDKMKSDFISIAAHQLRTPLSSVKWALNMIIGGDAGEISGEVKDLLKKSNASNERMIILVNEMLNVSRIEDGRFGYIFKKEDMGKVLEAVLHEQKSQVEEKGINLSLEIAKNLPAIAIDKEKIYLVFQNILDNAIKYTPEKGKIDITMSREKEEIRVVFSDSGVGIPEECLDKMFTKFFRAPNVMRMQTDGSGLGLFIAKNIIEQHGGQIGIRSKEGSGTDIIISIPVER